MLDGIKRWLGGSAKSDVTEWEGVAPWAQSHQYGFRAVPGEGFVVDGRLGATAWRLEWGPSQRPYIEGHELRLRSELGLGSDLQALVMNRHLAEQMEKTVFEQFVEGVQTRIDNQTPPEMRWLVMFSKLAGSEMGPLKERWVALSSQKPWLQEWLAGPLSTALAALHIDEAVPALLMIGRGRLMLRTAQAEPEVAPLQTWLRLFECAMREARRVAADNPDSLAPSSAASAWQQSALPGSEREK
ncbi:MAG: hypothetical protein IPM15_07720 [Betaproteobacteria bacterium]|nr:hypothetical protein [Betaproteobacteria bacterium]MCC6248813.1 hypothetical protein [Rubrivivax sp.]MCL4698068.1 hypothetical protein [Burkholderiaceae bacterium]